MAQSLGLIFGSLIIIILASSTGFATSITKLIKFNGVVYGTEAEIYKTKLEVEKLIQAQFAFHHWKAIFMISLYIASAVIVCSRFKEIDKDGRFYASQVFKDGLLVPSLPYLVEFPENKNSQQHWKERAAKLHQLKIKFKEFSKHSLITYETYT